MIRSVMTPASAARRAAAERIAPVYAANPKVAAVILAGSTARGHADRFSERTTRSIVETEALLLDVGLVGVRLPITPNWLPRKTS